MKQQQVNWTQVKQATTSNSSVTIVKPSELKVNDEFIGYYLELSKSPKFETPQYVFQKADGKKFILSSSGQLNKLLTVVPVGSLTKVVYKGPQLMKTGKFAGQTAHTWQVFFDKDNKLPKQAVAEATMQTAEDDDFEINWED